MSLFCQKSESDTWECRRSLRVGEERGLLSSNSGLRKINLVPRVLRLFGQEGSREIEKKKLYLNFSIGFPETFYIALPQKPSGEKFQYPTQGAEH